MGNTLLIHGYAAGLQSSAFPKTFGKHAGFHALANEIIQGDVALFRWGVTNTPRWIDLVNPAAYFRLYRAEESLAASQETQSTLYQCMIDEEASVLIAHSLGCRLLLNTINTLGLPPSIQRIIFLQADFDHTASITNADALNRLSDRSLTFDHYHCAWDPSLTASAMLHRAPRAGMVPWRQPSICNHFFPLLRPINLHTSPLRDRKFLQSLINVKKSVDVR